MQTYNFWLQEKEKSQQNQTNKKAIIFPTNLIYATSYMARYTIKGAYTTPFPQA